MKHVILIGLSVLVLSSCGSIQGKPSEIDIPATPIYPIIFGHELSCLTQDVYERLDDAKIMCRGRVKTLEDSIKAYNDSIK